MDLSFLKTLYQNQPGGRDGYVSVYLDTTPTSAGAAEQLSLRWRAARERLAGAGADDATLDAVEDVLSSRTHDARGQAVFAATGTVLLNRALPLPPRQEIARYAPLPHVMPLLAQLPARVPHVLIAADRAGGQVLTVSSTGGAAKGDVTGESWPVHKVSAGGWSEQRLQRSAEETWANNARLTADAARAAAQRVHAEFVVVGGDVKERTMVLDLLPPPLREAAVVVDKETAPDSPAFTEAADAEVARRTDSASRAQLDEFRVRMNEKDKTARRAVEGLSGTLAALRDGLVSDVLIAAQGDDDKDFDRDLARHDQASGDAFAGGTEVWVGPGLADTAIAEAGSGAREAPWPTRDRADAALARAAAGTGAQLFLIPPDADPPLDGVGALLRAPLSAV
jgi:hypothetical protein